MRIGELANAVGVSTDTIRFYEKQGLIDITFYERTKNNYRRYRPESIAHLKTIIRAKRLGFTLNEISELSTLWSSGKLQPKDKIAKLKAKLVELEAKKLELHELETTIRIKLETLTRVPTRK